MSANLINGNEISKAVNAETAAEVAEIVAKRLAPENPDNDGKQTPMKGHPVFIAQHATACCCRACLEKWHHIPAGKVLTEEEQAYVTAVITDWIEGETAPAP